MLQYDDFDLCEKIDVIMRFVYNFVHFVGKRLGENSWRKCENDALHPHCMRSIFSTEWWNIHGVWIIYDWNGRKSGFVFLLNVFRWIEFVFDKHVPISMPIRIFLKHFKTEVVAYKNAVNTVFIFVNFLVTKPVSSKLLRASIINLP